MSAFFTQIAAISAAAAGAAALCGTVAAIVRWFDRQSRQDSDIKNIKQENMMIVSALSACLDGLKQLGANHSVSTEKEKLDRYLNEQAHH